MQDSFPFNHFEFFNYEQLKGRPVFWMMQDHRGFIWIINDNGLKRFDGYTFRSWPYSASDPNALVQGGYSGMVEDNNGLIWMSSVQNGLYSFDPHLEKFTNYRHQTGNSNSLIDDRAISSVVSDKNGNIWVGTAKGLDKFNPQTKSFTHFTHRENDPTSISYNEVTWIVKNNQDSTTGVEETLWIINEKLGIDCFSIKQEKVIKHFSFPFSFTSRWGGGGNFDMYIMGIKNNVFWIGSDDSGIYGFNTITEQFIHIPAAHSCHSSLHVSGFYPVLEDRSGNLWTMNDDDELIYYDQLSQKSYLYNINRLNIADESKGNVFESFVPGVILEDNSGKILITIVNGVLAIDTRQKPFATYRIGGDNPLFSLSDNSIAHIDQHGQGPQSVCENLLNLLDRKNKLYSSFSFNDYGYPQPNTFLYRDSKGVLWIAATDLGIASYDPVTKKSRQYIIAGNSDPAINKSFGGIVEDLKGQYWAGNSINGLYKLDTASGMLRKFRVNNGNEPGTADIDLKPIFRDSKGIIYFQTREKGLVTFNPLNEAFTVYHHDPNDPGSISSETANVFHEGKNGLIWLGTRNQGLNVFDPSTGKFRAFPSGNELQDFVSGITEDKNGKYWIGSRNGIFSFTPPEDPFAPGAKIEFRNYNKNDGLPYDLISWNSGFCDDDGTLYFGSLHGGIIYFKPDDLKDNDFKPPVYITGFSLFNKTVNINDSTTVLRSAIEYTKEIRLKYKQNDISFTFAALNYIHPEKNTYKYILENYDKDWTITDASKRFASYTNLNPGTYIFKVKGSNNDGVWNEIPAQLQIVITPPFWQTWWFRVLVIATIAGLVYGIYRYRLSQVIRLQNIRNKISNDLHDDIGSTLNSISVYSEVAKHDSAKHGHALEMIGESSRKIIDAMSDIVWTINPENDSFENMILRMRSLAFNLLRAKNIEFTFKADEGLNKLKLSMEDRRNFFLIFKESINNLVKYAEATHVFIQLSHDGSFIKMHIHDNGKGFNTSQNLNGNGMNSMKQRAKEMNAQLKIESQSGVGTNIELLLKS